MSGLRRAEAPTRAKAPIVARDLRGLVKINPIATWTDPDVAGYVADHDVPVNPLLDQGYPSIGCRPCTQAVEPGADPRSGRWAGPDQDGVRPAPRELAALSGTGRNRRRAGLMAPGAVDTSRINARSPPGATPAVAFLAGLLVASILVASPALAQATGTTAPGSMPSTTTSTEPAPAESSTTTTSATTPPAATNDDDDHHARHGHHASLPQIGQGPLPGSPPPPTPVPPPAVTIPPVDGASPTEGLQGELAQFPAMDAYRRDQSPRPTPPAAAANGRRHAAVVPG